MWKGGKSGTLQSAMPISLLAASDLVLPGGCPGLIIPGTVGAQGGVGGSRREVLRNSSITSFGRIGLTFFLAYEQSCLTFCCPLVDNPRPQT